MIKSADDTCVALKCNQYFFSIFFKLLHFIEGRNFSEGEENSKTNLYLTLELAHLKQSEFAKSRTQHSKEDHAIFTERSSSDNEGVQAIAVPNGSKHL